MAENKSEQFDDLFQDFFGKEIDDLKKQVVDIKPVVSVHKPKEKESISAIINRLLPQDDKKYAPKKIDKVPTPQVIDLPKSKIESTIVEKGQLQEELPNQIQTALNETEKSNIEGGSSAYITNPESLIPRSQELDEILGYVPNWMIRWGITTVLIILMGIIVMSYFIKYPDIVNGQITITSNTPPATVLAKTNGSLKLFKSDKDFIKEGEVIALIKNDARYEDIQKLKESLEDLKLEIDKGRKLTNFIFPEGMDLGSLQGSFSELLFSLKNQQVQRISRGNDLQRKTNIDKQIGQITQIERDKNQQIKVLEAEYIRAKETYDKRYQPMFKNGSISADQLEGKLSEVTQKQNAYQNAKSGLSEYRKRVLDLEAQKDEIDFNDNQVSSTNFNSISSAYGKLINDINSWENQYLLTAPIDGRLNYLQFVKDNVNAKRDQEIASVVPITEEEDAEFTTVLGELFISSAGTGKVELGQTVNVELDAYLKKEYGIIEGEVLEIADVGTTVVSGNGPKTMYKILVGFEGGLKPTTDKEIIFKHNMKGKAEVITKDVRLIERIFNELREVVDAK